MTNPDPDWVIANGCVTFTVEEGRRMSIPIRALAAWTTGPLYVDLHLATAGDISFRRVHCTQPLHLAHALAVATATT